MNGRLDTVMAAMDLMTDDEFARTVGAISQAGRYQEAMDMVKAYLARRDLDTYEVLSLSCAYVAGMAHVLVRIDHETRAVDHETHDRVRAVLAWRWPWKP